LYKLAMQIACKTEYPWPTLCPWERIFVQVSANINILTVILNLL